MFHMLDQYQSTILLIFNTKEPYYIHKAYVKFFKHDVDEYEYNEDGREEHLPEEYALEHYVHTGMVQDSVIIDDFITGIDVRFFPYIGNRCSFYEWDIPDEFQVFILNESNEDMEFNVPDGRFLVKAGKLCHITKENKDDQSTESIAPNIDRWNMWDLSVDKGLMGRMHFNSEDEYETDEKKFDYKEVVLKEKIVCPVCGKRNFVLLRNFSKLICHECKKTYEIVRKEQ